MSELPEDIRTELQEALDDQLAQWGGDERKLHEANEKLLEVLRRARAFELANSDVVATEGHEVVTSTSALQAAIDKQAMAQISGDQTLLEEANQDLAEAYRRFNNGELPGSQ